MTNVQQLDLIRAMGFCCNDTKEALCAHCDSTVDDSEVIMDASRSLIQQFDTVLIRLITLILRNQTRQLNFNLHGACVSSSSTEPTQVGYQGRVLCLPRLKLFRTAQPLSAGSSFWLSRTDQTASSQSSPTKDRQANEQGDANFSSPYDTCANHCAFESSIPLYAIVYQHSPILTMKLFRQPGALPKTKSLSLNLVSVVNILPLGATSECMSNLLQTYCP